MSYSCAGIVLFNPEINRLDENISAIKRQVDKIILIDNNSSNIKDVIDKYGESKQFIIVKNNINKGIATALNQICEVAQSIGYDWVLLLDQDSIVSENLVNEYEDYISNPSIALITPYIIDMNKLKLSEYKRLDLPDVSYVDWAITSGSMIRIKTWQEIDGFFDDLFIDAVDLDYSIRLKINGYQQIRVNKAYLLQEVGNAEPTWIIRPHKDNAGKWSLKKYYRTNHSLLRQYYMTRNHVILARKYSCFLSMPKRLAFTIIMMLPKPFVEKNKLKLIKNLIKGFYDGFKFDVKKYN